ncbi:hypothetical protein BH10CYA1_BH10CYA1_09620 [soil metagenome]
MAQTAAQGETTVRERQGVERAEHSISQSPASPSPFLKELNEITGPNTQAGSGTRAVAQMERDGFAGRATALEAQQILDTTKGGPLWTGRLPQILGGTAQEITTKDIREYMSRPNLSAGEKALSQRLLDNFGRMSGDGQKITQANITDFEAKEKQHADLRQLYSRDGQGGRLLNAIVDKSTGAISGAKVDEVMSRTNLTASDRSSLEAVNKLRPTVNGSPSGDIPKDVYQEAARVAGVSPREIQQSRRQVDPRNADGQAGQAALGDFTARPGGKPSLYDRFNEQGGITDQRIASLLANPQQNNLTPQNIKTLGYLRDHAPTDDIGIPTGGYKPKDLQRLGTESGVNWDQLMRNPQRTPADASAAGRQQDLSHLFEKPARGGQSLYERLEGPEGGITQSRIKEELDKGLNAADRHTLEYVQKLAKDGTFYGKHDLSARDLVDRAHAHGINDRTIAGGGLNPRVSDQPAAAAGAAARPGEVSDSVRLALTVRGGEGYYHAAERLLSEAHKGQRYDPTQQELRALATQLKHANGDRTQLKSNEVLTLNAEVRSNSALAGLFK